MISNGTFMCIAQLIDTIDTHHLQGKGFLQSFACTNATPLVFGYKHVFESNWKYANLPRNELHCSY